MKADKLKKIITDLSPFRSDDLPCTSDIVLIPGKIGIRNTNQSVFFDMDHSCETLIGYGILKKFVSALDKNDSMSFQQNKSDVYGRINGKIETRYPIVEPDIPLLHDMEYAVKRVPLGRITHEILGKMQGALGFAGNNELRPAMMRIAINRRIAATDGHTMYLEKLEGFGTDVNLDKTEPLKNFEGEMVSMKWDWFLVSKEMAAFLVKQKQEVEAEVFAERQELSKNGMTYYPKLFIRFTGAGFEAIERLETENYPLVDRVWPDQEKSNHYSVVVDLKELVKSLKLAYAMANNTTHLVAFTFYGKDGQFLQDSMILKAENMDYGTDFARKIKTVNTVLKKVSMKTKVTNSGEEENEPVEMPEFISRIGFNAKLFLDLLSKTKDPKVNILLWSPNRAAVVNGKYLIMPVMLTD